MNSRTSECSSIFCHVYLASWASKLASIARIDVQKALISSREADANVDINLSRSLRRIKIDDRRHFTGDKESITASLKPTTLDAIILISVMLLHFETSLSGQYLTYTL